MKYLVASDIHGSMAYTRKLVEQIEKEEVNKVILLGDLYYHGPRNDLPYEYNPKEVANVFNNMKDKLLVVKGNCDAEVDEMISEFRFFNDIEFEKKNKRFYFTHGHHKNIEHIPANVDVLIYGHFHTGYIKEKDGVLCVNVGSISLPKNDTPHSYVIIDDEKIILKDLEGKIIGEIRY